MERKNYQVGEGGNRSEKRGLGKNKGGGESGVGAMKRERGKEGKESEGRR